MSSLLIDLGGGVIGGLLVMITYLLLRGRMRRDDAGAGAGESAKGTLKEHGKRIKQLEGTLKDLILRVESERKIADLRERPNVSVDQRFSAFRRELDAVAENFDKQLRLLENRIENRILLSSTSRAGPTANTGGVPASPYWQREESRLADRGASDRPVADNCRGADTQSFSSQHATGEPEETAALPAARRPNEREMSTAPETQVWRPEIAPEPLGPLHRPQAAPERRSVGDVSQLILSHFDEIDANSARRLDVMKTMYKALTPQITDIEDHNGAYLFKIVGSVWFVHPRPNASLDHYWERAFPRAESYSRVIQRVTCLARIHRTNDQEYEVLQEGSFVVR